MKSVKLVNVFHRISKWVSKWRTSENLVSVEPQASSFCSISITIIQTGQSKIFDDNLKQIQVWNYNLA